MPKAIVNDVTIPERRQTQPTKLRVQPRTVVDTHATSEDKNKQNCDKPSKLTNVIDAEVKEQINMKTEAVDKNVLKKLNNSSGEEDSDPSPPSTSVKLNKSS